MTAGQGKVATEQRVDEAVSGRFFPALKAEALGGLPQLATGWDTVRARPSRNTNGVPNFKLDDALSPETDPIGLAVRHGLRAGCGGTFPDPFTLQRAAELAASTKTDNGGEPAVADLLALVWEYPECERLQILAARLLDAKSIPGVSRQAWSGIHGRFPHAVEPFRMTLRWFAREAGLGAALEWLDMRFPSLPTTVADLLVYAWGHHELKSFQKSDEAFAKGLLAQDENTYLQFAKSLVLRGEVWRAHAILSEGIARLGSQRKLRPMFREVSEEIRTLEALVPRAKSGRMSDAALSELFARAAAQPRRQPKKRVVGRVAMITGSLGAGGAERQFTMTAKVLQNAIAENKRIAGYPVRGPVEVYCRSLSAKPGGDFFLPALKDVDIPVLEYSGLEPRRESRLSMLAPHRELLRFLPAAIAEGTIKLADDLRSRRPDIVQIWQDGSIYATGLAALLAGIPRIVLNVRTLPPIDRPDRFRPEYQLIFQSLLSAPNVTLTANSKVAARRYAEWLAVNPEHVRVIYNGVDLPDNEPSLSELGAAGAFDAATGDADFTIGGVMRFDENKRPLLWLQAAAALLHSAPRVRFILVGEGPLWDAARSYARVLGIAERVLFVGRSHAVKFWLRRMDAFVLLSLREGLPNVLVEAQQAGVPVCTTAAGGCAEAICPGESGVLLPAGEQLDPQLVAARLLDLKDNPGRRIDMGLKARGWAQANFSVGSMIEKTVATFMGDGC